MAVGSPGIEIVGTPEAADDAEHRASVENIHVWRIDLNGVHSKHTLLEVIARELRIPDYFGHNWDALEECLRDFDEGKGWLIIFESADSLLRLPVQDLVTFREILSSTMHFWGSEGRTFKILFVGSPVLSEEFLFPGPARRGG